MVERAVLMLVVVDAHPGLPGIIRTEERLELVHYAGEVKGGIFPAPRGFPEAERISFLNRFHFCEAQASVDRVKETIGVEGQPKIPGETRRRIK